MVGRCIALYVPLLVLAIALAALAGIENGQRVLAAWHPTAVAMKPMTACIFSFHAIGLLFFRWLWRTRGRWIGELALGASAISSAFMLGWMALTLFTVEDLSGLTSPADSRFPSLLTLAAFFSAALQEGGMIFRPLAHGHWCAWIVCLIGMLALVGYGVGAPCLYFLIPGVSTAMALNTAVAFVLLGLSLAQ